MSYHVSPNGPSLCHAKLGRCPYGSNGENHFSTVVQASRFYDTRMKEAFGGFEGVKKTPQQRRKERTYSLRDSFVAKGYALKASAPVAKVAANIKKTHDAPKNIALRVQSLSSKNWQKLNLSAASFKNISSGAATEIDRARDSFRAYTSKVSEVNKVKVLEYQKYVSLVSSSLSKETQASASGKLRPTSSNELRIGDKLANGTTITGLKLVKGTTTVTTRDPITGRFGKSVTLSGDAKVSVIRPRRQVIRQAGEAYKNVRSVVNHRTAMVSAAARNQSREYFNVSKGRVAYAASLQRQSYQALLGLDRELLQKRTKAAGNPIQDIQSIRSFGSARYILIH